MFGTRQTLRRATGWLATAVVIVGLSLAATACGSPAPTTTSTRADADAIGEECCAPAPGAAAVNGIETAHNGWDIAFINWLTPHDAVASQMAQLAPTRASSPQVKEIAAAIDAAQGPGFVKMAAMAAAWGQPVPSTDPAAAIHDHGGAENEAGNVTALAPLSGTAFDNMFLTVMIAHHQATLPMARATIENGVNQQDKQFAREVLAAQEAEIGRMQRLVEASSR